MKSWGPLSRHETAEGGRGPARPARRMPGLFPSGLWVHERVLYRDSAAGQTARTAKSPVMGKDVQYLITTTPATHTEWFR